MKERVERAKDIMNGTEDKGTLDRAQPEARGGRSGKILAIGLLVGLTALIPAFLDSPYVLHIMILIFIYTVASVSLRTITVSGQFPLAHGAFMGIGAYLTGMAAKFLGWSPWFTIPAAAVVTAAIGMFVGLPFSRLRALYYAMGSLFFGIGVLRIVYAFGDVTGGYVGLVGLPPLLTGSKVAYYYLFLAMALFSICALYRFEFSRIGTNLKAIAQSHLVASSVGINEAFYRILAVGVGCFFAGLAGAGYAHYNRVISPSSFDFMATMWLVMYVLIGGIDSFAGPIIGTFVLILIPELFRDLKMYAPFISAVILGIVVYLMPQGVAGLLKVVIPWRKGGDRKGASGAN
jgi:branched-chain amino acid transport system permease protein